MCRRLLCYGDSNTYGYDPRSYLGGRYPESVRWTALLNAEGWKVINKGENGRSIPRLNQEIETAVQTARGIETDILTVMLGSNDLLQGAGLSAEVCGERMERFLRAILMQTQGSPKILLVAPPPMAAGAWGVGLTYDGVHFSEDGHLAFAKGMQKALGDLF